MGSDEAIDTQNNDGSNEIKEEIYVIELNVCVTEVKKRQSSVVKATGALILRNKKIFEQSTKQFKYIIS